MGKMGLSHTSILSTIPGVELVACADPSPAAVRLARSVGVRVPFVRSVGDALDRGPHAAFVCLPSFLNAQVARQCAARGVHVFVEKPLASDLATARDMLALEREHPALRFGIGFMGAHIGTFARARDEIASGSVGSVVRAVARAEHSLVFAPQAQWTFKRRAAGGGAAMAIGSHAIAQVHRSIGRVISIERASCYFRTGNEVEDAVQALARVEGGAAVKMVFDWSAADRPQMTVTLEVVGTQGALRVSETWLDIETPRSRSVTHVSELPDPSGFYLGGDGYCLEDERFVALCREGGTPAVTWSDAYHVQEVIQAIYTSAESGTRMDLA